MNYTDIISNFEETVSYQNKKRKEIQSLSSFFFSYKETIETFANKLSKLSTKKKDFENTSLQKAAFSLYEHVNKLFECFQSFANSLQIDIIEPLDLFYENYYNTLLDVQSQGLDISKQYRSAQNRTSKLRSEYYQSASEAEKAARIAITEDSAEGQEIANKIEKKCMLKTEEYLNNYLDSFLMTSEKKEEYLKTVFPLMTCLQNNEESRIHFTKNSIEKYLRYFAKLEKNLESSVQKLALSCSEVCLNSDISIFVEQFSKEKEAIEDFMTYDEWKKNLNENEYEIVEKDVNILSSLQSLLEPHSEKSSARALSDLYSFTYTSEGRVSLVETLLDLEYSFIDKGNIILLSKAIRSLLDEILKTNEYNAYLFCKLVEISTKFHTKDPTKKSFSHYIKSHVFWKDPKRWVQGINYAVSTQTLLLQAKHKKNETTDSGEINKISSVSAYVIIGQFNYQLCKLEVPFDICVIIIKAACLEYKIEDDKVYLILVELCSKSKIELKTLKKPGGRNLNEFVLKKSCKFLSGFELSQVSRVNKSFKAYVKRLENNKEFHLSRLVDESNNESRRKLWLDILNTREVGIDYEDLLSSPAEKDETLLATTRIIEMDVMRSYQKSAEVTQTTLKNILKAYAVSNPKIGYCQGMNYLAGTLLYVIQDEVLAFKALSYLISHYKMSSLLTNNLKKVKKMVFVLDKLVSIHLPDLHNTFKDTWVLAEQFSTGWFISIFGSVFLTKFQILLQIWDFFLVKGWKGLFKISVCILKNLENKLVDKPFEEILYVLNNISSSDLFTSQFFSEALEMKITNRSIAELKRLYKSI